MSASSYSAWRLTQAGVRLASEAFPDEPLPDRLAERLAAAHLGQVDHREAVSRVYLKLVQNADPAERSARLSERASQVWWQAHGEVVLPLQALDGVRQLVPDATICGRHRAVRVFVEVDRSAHAPRRLAATFDLYQTFLRDGYAATFPDCRAPVLLFVVRSPGRKRSVEDLAARHLGNVAPWKVVMEGQATAFLEENLFDPVRLAAPTPAPPRQRTGSLRAVSNDMYRWVRSFQQELRVAGGDLPSEGRALLRRLYGELQPP